MSLKTIYQYLLGKGIVPKLRGFKYIETALELLSQNVLYAEALTTKLYPDVAKAHNTTWQRVERAIRHAKNTEKTNGEFLMECLYDLKDLKIIK